MSKNEPREKKSVTRDAAQAAAGAPSLDYLESLAAMVESHGLTRLEVSVAGGTVVMETVFNLPGVGRYLVDAIAHRDYAVVQTLVLLFAGIFVLINLATDVIYTKLDPRIRFT